MREINYLKKRFEFVMRNAEHQKGSFGTIHINANDIDAINGLIKFKNKNYSSQLEDSLLLFWILANWKFEIDHQKMQLREDAKGFLKLTDIKVLFDRMCVRLNPKENVITEITSLLQEAQRTNNIPKENQVTIDFVSDELEKVLSLVKMDFIPISQLHRFVKFEYIHPLGLTEKQKNLLQI